MPFSIPEKWKWCNFGNVVAYGKSEQVQPQNIEKSAWILDLEDIESGTGNLLQKKKSITAQSNKTRFRKGDVLYSKLRPYLNKVIVADDDGYCTTEIVPISPSVAQAPLDAQYLKIYLMSPYFVGYANQCSYGVKMPRLGTKDAQKALFPIPPIEEQRRIVAELNQLFEQIDRAEKAYNELSGPLSDRFRQLCLEKAIQGKLVPQLESEPGVEQIGEAPENVPFAIPEKWKWVAIGSVCAYIQRGKSPKYSEIQQIPVVAQKCNQWDGFHIEKAKFIAPETAASYKTDRWLQDKDVLWNSTGLGTLGRVALYKKQLNPYGCAVADSHVTVMRCSSSLLPEYLYYYICSPSVQSVVEEISDGSTKQKELATKTIREFQFPLPPIDEQRRIVAKLNKLLSSVAQIESFVSTL